ncbi:MAG: transglycosylase SLT domain-containing protein [Polyangiaceae bacterium]|nr:transglycosylase SLT domain-containing protein [Polyangiaceae bacterium]
MRVLTALAFLVSCAESSSETCPVASSAPEIVTEPAAFVEAEQPDLAGDFELLDPSANTTPSLEGLVTTLSDLPVPLTRLTMRYVEHFGTTDKGRQAFFERFHRASKYREHIERKLRDRDMPEDLLWVAAIESGFNPQAVSPAGAAGLFQFVPVTAERFGLGIAPDIDERRAITKATDAAIEYLAILHDQLGSWDLALAAYNCGEGRVLEAMDHARNKLKLDPNAPVAFHQLAEQKVLPRETAHYVPMIHAFAIVAHNRELLVLDDEQPYDSMHFAEIAVPSGTRLGLIAKAADISTATLREYNPDFLTDRVPGVRGDQLVQLPLDALEHTLAALPALMEREAERPATAPVSSAIVDEHVDDKPIESKGEKKEKKDTPPKPTLEAVSSRPNTYILSNGLFVELKEEASEAVDLSATIVVVDPTNERKPIGKTHKLEPRKAQPAELQPALVTLRKDLQKVLADAADDLRSHVAVRRRGFYARKGGLELFEALSAKAFPESHPMHGALLVGTTDRDDDLFLETEPPWALETTITLKGNIPVEHIGSALERALGSAFVPDKIAKLAASSRTALGGERDILIGWASPPLKPEDETAAHLAFLLACHPKLGSAHKGLRHGRSIAADVSCALELAPQSTVGWITATPIEPFTVADAEKAVDSAIANLVAHGPTDAELDAARGMLRTALAREREMAKLRHIPKSWVVSNTRRVRSRIKEVDTVDVVSAAKVLFAKEHRIVVTGG